MTEENVAGQQVAQATGTAAATPTPVQPVPQQPQVATPAASGDEWHTRYNGLQQVHQTTVNELKQAQALLQQNSQHAGTLEQQLNAAQTERTTLSQSVGEAQAQLAGLQRENNFWNIVSSEFADLLPLAGVLQRADTPERQREILQGARQAVGSSIQRQVTEGVTQAFQGVTPGVSPPPQQAANQFPSKEELLNAMDKQRPGTPEYDRLKAIWSRHPENGPQALDPNFKDPMRSDWDKIREFDEMHVVADHTQTQGPWSGQPAPSV